MLPFPGPRWCLAPELVRAVDRAANAAGLDGLALMETAGRAVAEVVVERWPAPGRAVVLVGGGGNGGDGLVAARALAAAGWQVEIVWLADPAGLEGDAARARDLLGPLPAARAADPASARAAVAGAVGATVVVDALLGAGLAGPVREPIASALDALAGLDVPVVAVDAPSGLSGATGRLAGAAPRAAVTVTFGFPRPGHFLGEGPERTGDLVVAPLGYPASARAAAGATPLEWIGLEEAEAALPARPRALHKGAAGRVLVVAGSEAYRGAAVLAARAAARAGAGLVVVAAPAAVADALLVALPEAIAIRLPERKAGGLAAAAAGLVAEAARSADAIAIGPGLGTGAGVRAAVAAALAVDVPAVVDADALNVLADDPAPVARAAPTVLTPHPGELGRWLGRAAADVDADRVEAARGAATRWDAVVLLKGAPTVVAEPDGRAALNLTGNPGLATGGSGDVLTGLVAALLAEGCGAASAARAGAFLHGLAADRAAADLGERSLLPSDLFAFLPLVVREIAAGRGAALLRAIPHPRADLLLARNEAA